MITLCCNKSYVNVITLTNILLYYTQLSSYDDLR